MIHFVSQSSFRRPRLPQAGNLLSYSRRLATPTYGNALTAPASGDLVQNSTTCKYGTADRAPREPPIRRLSVLRQIQKTCMAPSWASHRRFGTRNASNSHGILSKYARKNAIRESFCSRANSNRSTGIQVHLRILPRFAPV